MRFVARYQVASWEADSRLGPMTGIPTGAGAAPAGVGAPPVSARTTRDATSTVATRRLRILAGRICTSIDGWGTGIEHTG